MLPSSHQAVDILCDVSGQSVLADVVGSDGEGPVVSVGDNEGILQMQILDTDMTKWWTLSANTSSLKRGRVKVQ